MRPEPIKPRCSLCAARLCRLVLADVVRDEVKENLLLHAVRLRSLEADKIIEHYRHLVKLTDPEIVSYPDQAQALFHGRPRTGDQTLRSCNWVRCKVIRAAIAGLPKPIPNDSRGSSGTTGSNVTEKKLPNILPLSCVHSSEATPLELQLVDFAGLIYR